jgi:hypothetical protein
MCREKKSLLTSAANRLPFARVCAIKIPDRRRSSVIEQLIRNQQVRGSNPNVGSGFAEIENLK